jgi:hypothetical protein
MLVKMISGLLFIATIVACGGQSFGSCSGWQANAPDNLTVNKGTFDQITFVPAGSSGITIIGARFLPPANTLGITITQSTGNTFKINASAGTPSGVYNLTMIVQSSTTINSALCVDSIDEPIEITVP